MVLAISLALLAVEIGIRFLSPQQYFAATVNTWDREVGIRQIPGARGFIVCPEYEMDLIINSKGLRDKEYQYEKPAGIRRILCLGDSYTCGYGVQAGDTFPKLLESLLNAESGDIPGWEVLNAGVGSTGTANQLAYFETEGYKYNPDFVLLCFCQVNDFGENRICGLYSIQGDRLIKKEAPLTTARMIQRAVRWVPGYNTLFARSHLLNLLKYRVARFHFRELARKSVDTSGNSITAPATDPLTHRLLLALRDACARRNSRLVITVIPHYDGSDLRPITVDLVELARSEGIAYADLSPQFTQEQNQGIQHFHPHDHHWNVNGHRLAARILYNFLVNKGITGKSAGAREEPSG